MSGYIFVKYDAIDDEKPFTICKGTCIDGVVSWNRNGVKVSEEELISKIGLASDITWGPDAKRYFDDYVNGKNYRNSLVEKDL